MSQTTPPEQRALSFLQVRTTSRQGKDWSVIIWANSTSTSPREFEASHELLLALLDFRGQTYLESSISDVGREARLRAEILRLAGPAADLLSQKKFLQVVFPSENYRFLACLLLRNSYACEEYRPPPPAWMLPDDSVNWHGTKFRIEEFLDDVDEAMAGRRMAQHSWDDTVEESGPSRRNSDNGSRSPVYGFEKSPQPINTPTARPATQKPDDSYPMTPVSTHSASRKRKWVWDSTIDEEYGLKSPPLTPINPPEPVQHERLVTPVSYTWF